MVDIIFFLKTMEQVPMLLWRCRHHDISWSTDVVYDVTIKGHCDLLPPSCFGGHRHFRYPFSFGCHITLEIEIVNNLRIYLRPRTAVHLCCNMQRIIMVFLQSGLVVYTVLIMVKKSMFKNFDAIELTSPVFIGNKNV